MNNKVNICGSSFEDLSEEEMMLYDGGFAAEAAAGAGLTFASSALCGLVSAGVTVLATVTILMTADII